MPNIGSFVLWIEQCVLKDGAEKTRHPETVFKTSGSHQNQTHLARTDFCLVIYTLHFKHTSECSAFQLQSTQAE